MKKKETPNWMNCECKCHGNWGEGFDEAANSCPHCKPEQYSEYKFCEQCKKPIEKGDKHYTCKSIEKEDYGRIFYVHKLCMERNYSKEGMQN